MKIRQLSKTYTLKSGIVKALDGVNIDLPEKGLIIILGKSGSGKSTLLNLLSGLDCADKGSVIEIGGKDIVECSEKERAGYRNSCCGFVFQEYNLISELKVKENVKLSCELQGEKNGDKAADDALDKVGLSGYGERKITELSGGQKQRVAIARAIVKNPQIIFADEPTGALDEATGESIFELLKSISESKLVVTVTHDREYAEKYGDRIIELSDGKIISDSDAGFAEQEQTSKEYKKPKLPIKAAAKIGCANFKFHPIRLAATILLSVIAFTFLGVCLNIAATDPRDNYIKAVYESGMEYAVVYKQKADNEYNEINQSFDLLTDNDLRKWNNIIITPTDESILKKYYNGPIGYVQEVSISDFQKSITMPLQQLIEETLEDERAFAISTDSIMHLSLDDCEQFGFSVIGRLPENENEVAINDNILNAFIYGGMTVDGVNYTFKCAEDILGFKIDVAQLCVEDDGHLSVLLGGGSIPKTIVGVVNTGCNKSCRLKHSIDDNGMRKSYHLHDKIFVCDGYIKHESISDLNFAVNLNFAIIKIDKDFDKLANFVLDYEQDETRYILTMGNKLNYYIISNYLNTFKFFFLYLSIVFFIVAFVLLANFAAASIRSQIKQIGILSAMGADKKSLLKIYGFGIAVVCFIVYVLSIIASTIVIVILNNYVVNYYEIIFDALWFDPIVIIALLGSVFISGIIGLIVPLLKIRKLSPTEAILKGQIK